ncbi:MAG: hypothetical protein FJ033_03925 [Chloroflexi bacterium]|nr:hypothetical protein [Chloroflexota bacterium]
MGHRTRYLVFFELCFVGLWCLAAFLFALYSFMSDEGPLTRLLALVQVALTVVTLLVTHVTLRTVFRRDSSVTSSGIARSGAFRAVPWVVLSLAVAHLLLIWSASDPFREFAWGYSLSTLAYVLALALGWHYFTHLMLARAGDDPPSANDANDTET